MLPQGTAICSAENEVRYFIIPQACLQQPCSSLVQCYANDEPLLRIFQKLYLPKSLFKLQLASFNRSVFSHLVHELFEKSRGQLLAGVAQGFFRVAVNFDFQTVGTGCD